MKLVWNLPRSTHNYFVENLLAEQLPSVRSNIFSFLQRLRKSVSTEVRLMCQIAAADIRSLTGKNCHNIVQEFNLRAKYSQYEVPDADSWRLLIESLC